MVIWYVILLRCTFYAFVSGNAKNKRLALSKGSGTENCARRQDGQGGVAAAPDIGDRYEWRRTCEINTEVELRQLKLCTDPL